MGTTVFEAPGGGGKGSGGLGRFSDSVGCGPTALGFKEPMRAEGVPNS